MKNLKLYLLALPMLAMTACGGGGSPEGGSADSGAEGGDAKAASTDVVVEVNQSFEAIENTNFLGDTKMKVQVNKMTKNVTGEKFINPVFKPDGELLRLELTLTDVGNEEFLLLTPTSKFALKLGDKEYEAFMWFNEGYIDDPESIINTEGFETRDQVLNHSIFFDIPTGSNVTGAEFGYKGKNGEEDHWTSVTL